MLHASSSPLEHIVHLLGALFNNSTIFFNTYIIIAISKKSRGESVPQSSNNPFHIGLRTFKTAVSVFICVVLFRILHRGSPMLAALSAIFSLRTDHQQTFKFALSRCIGNTTGGVVAILFILRKSCSPIS